MPPGGESRCRIRGSAAWCVVVEHPAAPGEHESGVRERSEVTRCPERSDLGHGGCDSGVQQLRHDAHEKRPDPAVACGERACSQQLHGADHLALDEGPHSRGMAVDECLLDAHGFLGGDPVACQGAESSRNAVDVAVLVDSVLDDRERGRHAAVDLVGDLDQSAVAGDVDDLFDGQGLWAESHVRVGRFRLLIRSAYLPWSALPGQAIHDPSPERAVSPSAPWTRHA